MLSEPGPILVGTVQSLELTFEKLTSGNLIKDEAIRLVVVWVKIVHHVFDPFAKFRLFNLLGRLLFRLGLVMFYHVVGCNDVPVGEVEGLPLARQKASLVKDSRDSIHLDKVLDILLYIQPLLGHLELLMDH